MNDEQSQRLSTPQELADFLVISRDQLRRLIREGVIPYVRIGRDLRFDVREVLAALRVPEHARVKDPGVS